MLIDRVLDADPADAAASRLVDRRRRRGSPAAEPTSTSATRPRRAASPAWRRPGAAGVDRAVAAAERGGTGVAAPCPPATARRWWPAAGRAASRRTPSALARPGLARHGQSADGHARRRGQGRAQPGRRGRPGPALTGEVFPLPGLHYTRREPWGVVGRMITFNHPAMFACARLGAALVAGNTVVLKPSELAPLAPLAIAELDRRACCPTAWSTWSSAGPATGEALVRHPAVLRLSFTGSTATALRIQAAAAASGRVKTLTFELGGKNPIVVFEDVDVEEAAAAIVRGMNFTRVQGQSCGSTSRLVVHEAIAEPMLARVAELAARIRLGPPADPATEMGSLIDAAARDRCLAVVERAVAGGARLVGRRDRSRTTPTWPAART